MYESTEIINVVLNGLCGITTVDLLGERTRAFGVDE